MDGIPVSQGEVLGIPILENISENQVIIQSTSSNGTPIYQTLVQRGGPGGQLWRVGAGGSLDTVQLVHSYNLPPEQEQIIEQEQVVEQEQTVVDQSNILIEQCGQHLIGKVADEQQQAQNLSQNETVIEEQVVEAESNLVETDNFEIPSETVEENPIYSFKKPIFFENLKHFYTHCEYTDTVIICKGGSRKIHSFVLGAASSLMKNIFSDISTKILDSEMVILMPDVLIGELDLILRPIYGFSDSQLNDQEKYAEDMRNNLFAVDFNHKNMIIKSEEKEKQQLKEVESEVQIFDDYTIDDVEEAELKPKSKSKRSKAKKTKYGYKYDDFIDDSEDLDSDDDDWEEPEPKPKKKRGRPKKIKEEELDEEYDDDGDDFEETYLEPIVKVKEEAIERTFDEFNEFFAVAAMMIEAKISFNQDDLGVFHCEAQGCVFSTLIRASIQQHVRQTHSAGGYQQPRFNCGKCGEAWANELYFKKHFESNECVIQQELPYVCENCGKGWYNLTNYTKHSEARECKTVVDMTNKHKCINCNLSFFSLRNRETHVRKAHMPPGETQYRCARCDINFITHKEFNLHKKTIHANEGPKLRYNCRIPDCTFESGKKEDLAFHVKSNHPNSVHICTNCGRNFADNQKLLQHLASHARSGKGRKCMPANYNCPHCPREFNRKRHMELHVLFKHSQDRPFSCEQCGKKFKTRHCVNIHLRSHGIGGYSWCCEECGKTFNQISAYHVHLKVHSNVRDFACEDCGMTFKLKHSLKKHQLVHKAEFGHTCDFCGKKFKRSDNLINHRRRHTGEHPYKCDKCSWTGPDSSSFIHHKKKHAEPVHNVHQEVKHGVFTHLSQGHVQGVASQMIDQKPQINLQTIQEMKPIVHSSMSNIHQSQKPQVNLQTVQEMKPIVHSSPSNMSTIHHPEIKLIHAITKIQHQGQHSPM